MGKCKTCGKNADSDYCFQHKPRKGLAKTSNTLKKEHYLTKSDQFLIMRNFFLSIWNSRLHKSEISNTYLGKEAMSTYFHHILPKENYPQASLDEENIILLTLDEHCNVENDTYKYEEINKRREYLKIKYGIL